jgi:CRISPR-associated protein Cas2
MTADSSRRYLVAYDIADDRRRSNIAKRLSAYGDRVQYSVFVCDLKPARFVRLQNILVQLISPDEDSILTCDLGQTNLLKNSSFAFLGASRYVTPQRALVV